MSMIRDFDCRFLFVISIFFITACGDSSLVGSTGQETDPGAETRTLIASYPVNDQTGVSVSSFLSLYFEGAGVVPRLSLVQSDQERAIDLTLVEDEGDKAVFKMSNLQLGTSYRLMVGDTALEFSTISAASAVGTPQLVESNIDSSTFPLTDRSSYYLNYSEHLDPASVTEARVVLRSASTEHPVRVSIDRENVVISPQSPLPTPGPWTLEVAGLYDLSGVPIPAYSRRFEVTPMGSLSRINVATYNGAGRQSSVLTSSVLFGDVTSSISAETGVYLGDPLMFDGYQPLLIKKGTEFIGSPLDIQLGGVAETTLNTSDLRFTVLNDSIGYLQKNSLTESFDSPQSVEVRFDLGVSTSEPRTQSIITQSVLNVRAYGLSKVVDSQLLMSLTSVTSLNLLEAASIDASIDLVLNTVDRVTADFDDVVAPGYVSSAPANGQNDIDLDQSVTMLFNEALAPQSLNGRIFMMGDTGRNIPIDWRVNGGKISIFPQIKLSSLTEYTIRIDAGVSDIAGNTTVSPFTTRFKTAADSAQFANAPRIEGMIPGVGCTLVDADLSSNIAGYCRVQEGGDRSQAYSVFQFPANQPIELWLNTLIEPASAYAATSCSDTAPIAVRRVDWSNGVARCLSAVPGSVELFGRNMRFVPHDDLVVGASYQFIVHAGADNSCDNAELCGINEKPVDTDPLDGEYVNGGGDDIVAPFIAIEPGGGTYQPLLSRTRTDRNANRRIDNGEIAAPGSSLDVRMDLCDASRCTDPFPLNPENVCAFPGAQPTLPGYSCNPDAPRTMSFLKARVDGSNLSYADLVLPITIGTAEANPFGVGERLPVRVPVGLSISTETNIAMQTLIDIPVPTGAFVFRFKQSGTPGASTTPIGYIATDPQAGNESKFTLDIDVLIDAPELSIPTGGDHNLKNRELRVKLSSLITYNDRGQFMLDLRNEEIIKLPVKITGTLFGVADGDLVFEIPKNGFKVDIASRLPSEE